jgi:hypothetical protein
MNIIKGSDAKITCTVYTYYTGDVLSSVLATPAQMTGATAMLYVKARDTDPDSAALFSKPGTVTDVNAATVDFAIVAADTNNINYQAVFFEAVVKTSDGKYWRTGVQPFVIQPNLAKTLF